MRIFLAGSRSYTILDDTVKERLGNIMKQNFTVLIGDCHGFDTLAQQYLYQNNYKNVFVYSSNGKTRNNIGNWSEQHITVPSGITGRDFYGYKDQAMAFHCDYSFQVWDGESRGTLNNMINLIGYKKGFKLFYFTKNIITDVNIEEDWKQLIEDFDLYRFFF